MLSRILGITLKSKVANKDGLVITLIHQQLGDVQRMNDDLILTDFLGKRLETTPQKSVLRWLETVSSTYILIGRYNHSLSLDATIMVSLKKLPNHW